MWLGIRVKRVTFFSVNTVFEVQPTQTFGEISTIVTGIKENQRVTEVEIANSNGKFNMVATLSTPASVCEQFSAFSVVYELECEKLWNLPQKTH